MKKKNKLLALDPGSKNIGIALSDTEHIAAFAKETVPYTDEGLQKLIQICQEEGIQKIILGIPLKTDRHHPSQKLANQLTKLLPNQEIILFNEDFSTDEALKRLKQAGYNEKEIQEKRDSMSAQVILEQYMTTDQTAS